MAERHGAIHAARTLVLQLVILAVFVELEPVAKARLGRPSQRQFAWIFQEPCGLTHRPPLPISSSIIRLRSITSVLVLRKNFLRDYVLRGGHNSERVRLTHGELLERQRPVPIHALFSVRGLSGIDKTITCCFHARPCFWPILR